MEVSLPHFLSVLIAPLRPLIWSVQVDAMPCGRVFHDAAAAPVVTETDAHRDDFSCTAPRVPSRASSVALRQHLQAQALPSLAGLLFFGDFLAVDS